MDIGVTTCTENVNKYSQYCKTGIEMYLVVDLNLVHMTSLITEGIYADK